MSSNANSAADKPKRSPQENEIPPGDRRDQPTASSLLGLPTPPNPAESNPPAQPNQVASAVGEGGSGLGGSTNRGIYARPTPPRRSTPRTYISDEGSPAPKSVRGAPLKTRIPSGRQYFPKPEMDLTEEDMKRDDGTEYETKAEALFEKSWKKFDPNRLGTVRVRSATIAAADVRRFPPKILCHSSHSSKSTVASQARPSCARNTLPESPIKYKSIRAS